MAKRKKAKRREDSLDKLFKELERIVPLGHWHVNPEMKRFLRRGAFVGPVTYTGVVPVTSSSHER